MSLDPTALSTFLAALAEIPARLAAMEREVGRMATALAALPPPLARIEDAATSCSVSVATMRRWVRKGLVPVVKVGGTVRVDLARLQPPNELEIRRLAAKARGTS